MADRSSSSESNKTRWPLELKDFDASLFLGGEAADLERLGQALAGVASRTADPARGFAIRLFLPDPELATVARLTYRPQITHQGSQIQLTVQRPTSETPAPQSDKEVRNWEKVWEIIEKHLLPEGKKVDFYISARFEFSTDVWQPVASLPAPMAGLVPDIAGVALLTGFSLEFPEQRQPIRRLSITVYPPLKEIDGRLYFYVSQSAHDTLPTSVVKIATSYQNLIAKPAQAESKPVEVTA